MIGFLNKIISKKEGENQNLLISKFFEFQKSMLNNLQNLQGKVVIKKYNSKYLENCKSKPSKNCLP